VRGGGYCLLDENICWVLMRWHCYKNYVRLRLNGPLVLIFQLGFIGFSLFI
jgi:hypothetical protein